MGNKTVSGINIVQPVMYEWPESQICMECPHGEFVMSDKLNNSNYLCMVGCDKNSGISCPNLPPKSAVKSVEVADPRINKGDQFQCTLYITLHNGKVYAMDVESMKTTKQWAQGDE